jgi:hypothetical protein
METVNNIRCNCCDWEGVEEELILLEQDMNGDVTAVEFPDGSIERYYPKPEELWFCKGCPNCETDEYLMNIE